MHGIEKIAQRFALGRKNLVAYVMAGDPSLAETLNILRALAHNGVGVIELGMPFSDPMADGPVIQAAALRAIAAGASLKAILAMLAQFTAEFPAVPVILMGYINPVMQYGEQKFVKDAAASGAAGLLLADMPPEEDSQMRGYCLAEKLAWIRLATPTSDVARLPVVLKDASGYIFYVSIAGITGTAKAGVDAAINAVARIKAGTDLPVVVGFGVSEPEQAAAIARFADGVVVGSALVADLAHTHQAGGNITQGVAEFVQPLVKAIGG
ncbi:MAG: tryptophan synthase subunit alpha [Alphaproteobacteria bacterium]